MYLPSNLESHPGAQEPLGIRGSGLKTRVAVQEEDSGRFCSSLAPRVAGTPASRGTGPHRIS